MGLSPENTESQNPRFQPRASAGNDSMAALRGTT